MSETEPLSWITPALEVLWPLRNLYVANYTGNTVSEFAPGSTTASVTYSVGLSNPKALAFDSSGDLYVANYGSSTVLKFAPGSTTASVTYSAGISHPQALTFDSSGNLYVANLTGNTVSKFAPGSTTVSATYSAGLNTIYALTVDSSGDLYVPSYLNGTVLKYAPGSTTASATYSGLSNPDDLILDSSGNLYVANAGNSTVSEFAPGSTTASVTYSAGLSTPHGLAVDSSGNLYVGNYGNSTVVKYTQDNTTPAATLSGVNDSIVLVFDSSGNLYSANSGNSTVSKFSPTGGTPTAGGIVIQSSVESRPMLLGNIVAPVAGINLSNAELAQIFTSAMGTVTVGDTNQTGNITFITATPATTPGAAVDVIQSTSSSATISLFDSGTGTGLNGNGGTVSLTPGIGGVFTNLYSVGTPLVTNGFSTTGEFLTAVPAVTPTIGEQFTIINNTATPAASNPINGSFNGLSQGSIYTVSNAGTTYYFQVNYQGGDGNDLVLTNVAGPATQFIVTSQPSTVTAGSTFGLTITAEDAQGNVATTFTGSVTVALAGGPVGGTLGGTVTVSATSGVATFSSLNLNKVGSYTLGVASGTLASATTSAISVTPGTATQLLITAQPPSTVTAGNSFGFTVTAEDAQGNVATSFTGSETLALASGPGGGTLGGALTVSANSGIATFSSLNLNKVGSYTLGVGSGTLASATTSSISVTPGTATQLLITAQPPSTVTAGGNFGFTVTAEDAEGNVATGFTGTETVALASGPGGGTLGGAVTVSATGGIATFSSLNLNKLGDYTLGVASGPLTSATTSSISVTPGTATQLLITAQPPSTLSAGNSFGFTVTAEDAEGNTATGFTGSETVAVATGPGGGTLGGAVTVSATSGIATFSSLNLNRTGSYTLGVTSGTLMSATTSSISVTPGTATQLLITAQPPSTVSAGSGFGFTVTAEDAEGNVATGFNGSETVALASEPGGGTLGGAVTVSATSGVATFSSLNLNKVGRLHAGGCQRHARVGHDQPDFGYAGNGHAVAHHGPAPLDPQCRQQLWIHGHRRRRRRQYRDRIHGQRDRGRGYRPRGRHAGRCGYCLSHQRHRHLL